MIQRTFVFVLDFNQSHATATATGKLYLNVILNLCRQLKTLFIKMKIFISFTQVYEALAKSYGRIGVRVVKTKTSLPVVQLTSSRANLSLILLG